MKDILAAVAALSLLAAPAFAGDDMKSSEDKQSTSPTGNTAAGSDEAGKNTNSDGSASEGASSGTGGTSVNDGAGSAPDQQPASGDKSK